MNILFPFQDDSSLILARTMGDELVARGVEVTYAHVTERIEVGSKVSARQMKLYLPQGPDIYLEPGDLLKEELLTAFDAVVTCRLLLNINRALDTSRLERIRGRACFVAFWAGLDFFPQKGVFNRRNYDVVFLLQDAHRRFLPDNARAVYVGCGHPYFIHHDIPKAASTGPILFATQSISPLTLAGRVHMTNLIVACALANPDREIIVKLRHQADENRHHAHKEVFAYEDLARQLYPRLPRNLSFNDDSMAAALYGAGGCVACTSTAVIDSLAAGVPTLVYLDYPGSTEDRLNGPMRDEFRDSNLIGTERQVLSLDFPKPDRYWLNLRFTTSAMYDEMLTQIDRFHSKRRSQG